MSMYVGIAGWSIAADFKAEFSNLGSQLQNYSSKFNAVEINTSFYREHKLETYQKWASQTPRPFVFSVKLNRYFTQYQRLHESGEPLKESLRHVSGLGDKWKVLLIQLPPSLAFDKKTAEKFFKSLRKYCDKTVVLEPRHLSWSSDEAIDLMVDFDLDKVIADPERSPIHSRKNEVRKTV